MKFVLATANPGKVKEMQELLGELNIDVVTRTDLGIDIDIEETGTTFFENAKLKAEAICRISKMPSIADDSGLITDALHGEPGVYSSSFGGEHLSAEERCSYLLKKMENMEQRSAKFVCTIICVFPEGNYITANGECTGVITTGPKGSGGFGYDPVFMPDGFEKTMAELRAEEKNKISHRGKALREFYALLKAETGSAGESL
ncbi:MAG: RdgB/HAM1 family non-canonical purine NTP pyrophosphatase [Oscillospiraceae bacterium]|nr:RdgB/HAM1 family non-canonical purine NTP pyrophosphatase [Oscillospiraceae bacterium]